MPNSHVVYQLSYVHVPMEKVYLLLMHIVYVGPRRLLLLCESVMKVAVVQHILKKVNSLTHTTHTHSRAHAHTVTVTVAYGHIYTHRSLHSAARQWVRARNLWSWWTVWGVT